MAGTDAVAGAGAGVAGFETAGRCGACPCGDLDCAGTAQARASTATAICIERQLLAMSNLTDPF